MCYSYWRLVNVVAIESCSRGNGTEAADRTLAFRSCDLEALFLASLNTTYTHGWLYN
jgi:hypothetical protein